MTDEPPPETAMLKYLALFAALSISPTLACGSQSDCLIGDRTYRVLMPEMVETRERIGAIVFSHGYRGTAVGIMRNTAFSELANDLGVAIIAVKSGGDDWDLPGAPRKPDETGESEFAYFDAVIADASARFEIDPQRLMASGFSAGGMMTWNLACHRSNSFAGFAPISGTFWQPEPQSCDTPAAHVIHIHGDADRTVPLTGRRIADTHQGDVVRVLEMYAQYGGYGPPEAQSVMDLTCQTRMNGEDKMLKFCLFEGGHSFKAKYLKWAWEQLANAGSL